PALFPAGYTAPWMTRPARSTAAAAAPRRRTSGCASRRRPTCNTSPRGQGLAPVLFESPRSHHQSAIGTDESAPQENAPGEVSDRSLMLFACAPTPLVGTLA